MAFKVEWTKRAGKGYNKIIVYLLENWSAAIAEDFILNVEAHLENLCQFPHVGMQSAKEIQVRRIVITKHNKLYYRIVNNKIQIVKIIDTRQHPAKNRFE